MLLCPRNHTVETKLDIGAGSGGVTHSLFPWMYHSSFEQLSIISRLLKATCVSYTAQGGFEDINEKTWRVSPGFLLVFGRLYYEECQHARVGCIIQNFPSSISLFFGRVVPNHFTLRIVGRKAYDVVAHASILSASLACQAPRFPCRSEEYRQNKHETPSQEPFSYGPASWCSEYLPGVVPDPL